MRSLQAGWKFAQLVGARVFTQVPFIQIDSEFAIEPEASKHDSGRGQKVHRLLHWSVEHIKRIK